MRGPRRGLDQDGGKTRRHGAKECLATIYPVQGGHGRGERAMSRYTKSNERRA